MGIKMKGVFLTSLERRRNSHQHPQVARGPHPMRFADVGDEHVAGFGRQRLAVLPEEKPLPLQHHDAELPFGLMGMDGSS